MFNFGFRELFSSQDYNQILEAHAKLTKANIKAKVVTETNQRGLPDMYSLSYKASPLDYDDTKIYTILVKGKEIDKACELLSLKKSHK